MVANPVISRLFFSIPQVVCPATILRSQQSASTLYKKNILFLCVCKTKLLLLPHTHIHLTFTLRGGAGCWGGTQIVCQFVVYFSRTAFEQLIPPMGAELNLTEYVMTNSHLVFFLRVVSKNFSQLYADVRTINDSLHS